MEQVILQLQSAGIRWEKNLPLAKHSSFRIGGAADLAVFPTTRAQMVEALKLFRASNLPLRIIGKASNVVFPDEGIRGAVLFTTDFRMLSIEGEKMKVGAGVPLSAIANAARDASLTGAEFAYGIPGTLGGAVYMNAGAFGGCMSDICTVSEYYDLENGTFGALSGEKQGFGTRTSIYQRNPSRVILRACLTLSPGEREAINATMSDFLSRRRSTQPTELPSAGSVFKRPVGYFAGKLIEDCGLKGTAIGGAEVSEKHAGFIVNRGGATAEDVRRLVELVRETVLRETGVTLECEIEFL